MQLTMHRTCSHLYPLMPRKENLVVLQPTTCNHCMNLSSFPTPVMIHHLVIDYHDDPKDRIRIHLTHVYQQIFPLSLEQMWYYKLELIMQRQISIVLVTI